MQYGNGKPMMLIQDKRDQFHTGSNDYRLFFLKKGGQVNRIDVRHDGKTTQYSKRSTFYPPESIKLPASQLADYVGNYKFPKGDTMVITKAGNHLRCKLGKQPYHDLKARSRTRFFVATLIAEISFLVDDSGKAHALVLHQNGKDQLAPKVP